MLTTARKLAKFYGKTIPIERVAAKDLPGWVSDGRTLIGVTNYEALTDSVPQGDLGAMILDESSLLKSHYGKWGAHCIRLGKGLEYKLALTGTPAPNDRIEFANHAVFMDAFPTVNSFLARYFVNRGQTNERWELKSHALPAFYRSLSHWCIFLTNPATYGWRDNCGTVPPIVVNVHDVEMTDAQHAAVFGQTRSLFVDGAGGITSRSALGRIGKGSYKGEAIATNKPEFMRKLVDSWPDESTLIWCRYNQEQEDLEKVFPEAVSITGATPIDKREVMVDDFKAGRKRVLISKGKILGFGLNLQIATRQVFSSCEDSYETFYQCVKRSNRIGSKLPLNVHIPITEAERPMLEPVLRKADRVQKDTEQQEQIFKEHANVAN